jgi:hypothetical protein
MWPCASLAGLAVGWKGWGIAHLGLVEELDWDADCGRHFDGGVCVLELELRRKVGW